MALVHRCGFPSLLRIVPVEVFIRLVQKALLLAWELLNLPSLPERVRDQAPQRPGPLSNVKLNMVGVSDGLACRDIASYFAASRAPRSKAFRQSMGKTSSIRFFFFSGSKRGATYFA